MGKSGQLGKKLELKKDEKEPSVFQYRVIHAIITGINSTFCTSGCELRIQERK